MPRQARETTDKKVYHAILRGVNKQQIFECTEDYEQFVRILQRQCGLPVETRPSRIKENTMSEEDTPRHCYIYAWCLMGNHVHLLIKENDETIGDVMKRISSSYVYYYNHKYDRIGHLFQERFKSQPVEDWNYFVTLLRYIHQNPLKPHIVTDLREYRWCSWQEYLGKSKILPFTSTPAVLSRITLQELSELINKPLTEAEEYDLIDIDTKPKYTSPTDEEIWHLIQEYCGATNPTEFQAISRPLQKHILYMAHEAGAGTRALSRLTGVSYSIVQKATSAENERRLQSSVLGEEDDEEAEYLTYCDNGTFEQFPDY